ncbi:MAG: IreB family regulatory phosphoprotein [Clostridiales bacterium]|nr:IreB family regulatory phosphoprotein [Clostridiales bacterium]
MAERFNTTKLRPLAEGGETASDILAHVYRALQAKGYDPITQLTGFVLTGDPTYITSFDGARSMICRLERDEILEELVRFYVEVRLNG